MVITAPAIRRVGFSRREQGVFGARTAAANAALPAAIVACGAMAAPTGASSSTGAASATVSISHCAAASAVAALTVCTSFCLRSTIMLSAVCALTLVNASLPTLARSSSSYRLFSASTVAPSSLSCSACNPFYRRLRPGLTPVHTAAAAHRADYEGGLVQEHRGLGLLQEDGVKRVEVALREDLWLVVHHHSRRHYGRG